MLLNAQVASTFLDAARALRELPALEIIQVKPRSPVRIENLSRKDRGDLRAELVQQLPGAVVGQSSSCGGVQVIGCINDAAPSPAAAQVPDFPRAAARTR